MSTNGHTPKLYTQFAMTAPDRTGQGAEVSSMIVDAAYAHMNVLDEFIATARKVSEETVNLFLQESLQDEIDYLSRKRQELLERIRAVTGGDQ